VTPCSLRSQSLVANWYIHLRAGNRK
jgi:hypothetical protein